MVELSNDMSVLEEVLNSSRDDKKIGVRYSKNLCLCSIECYSKNGMWVEDLEEFQENVTLNEGFYLVEDFIFAKKGTLCSFDKITDSVSGVLGELEIGVNRGGEAMYVQACVFENQEEGLVGEKIYLI